MLKKVISIILTFMLANLVCAEKKRTGGPFYFKSWKSYIIPYQPIHEINVDDTKKLKAYYIAYFNNYGKVVKFLKVLDNKTEFTVDYKYRTDGTLEQGETLKQNGDKIVQHFDENGKLIKN